MAYESYFGNRNGNLPNGLTILLNQPPQGIKTCLPGIDPKTTPIPAFFKTYSDFAVAVLNNNWQLFIVNGCGYYNAAGVEVGGKKYLYISTQNINSAFWFWDNTYVVPPPMNMGTRFDYDSAMKAGLANAMHLVCPDRIKADGGFSSFAG